VRGPGRERRAVLALALVAAAACQRPAAIRYEQELEATPPPAEHAVHGARLRELMRGLDRLARERLPQAMDLRAERARRLAGVADVAGAMADSAARIDTASAEIEIDAARRGALLALAADLERDARALAQDAPRLGDEALRARVAALEATCDACHRRFRPEPRGSEPGAGTGGAAPGGAQPRA
jgi:cytochrome c556